MQKKTNVTWSYDSTKYCSATAGKCPCGLEVTISLSDTEEPFDDKLASGVEDKELGLAPTRPKRKAKASLYLADYVSQVKGVREGNDSQKGGRTGSASSLQGNVSTRRCGIDGELDDYIDGSLVYDPLMKRGCINEEGRFVWSDSNGKAEASTETEVEAFLADEQVLPFQQRIESAAVEDVDGRDQLGFQLPEDILPSYDVARPTEVLATNVPERMSKKQKAARGPVQATKQSTRINRSEYHGES